MWSIFFPSFDIAIPFKFFEITFRRDHFYFTRDYEIVINLIYNEA